VKYFFIYLRWVDLTAGHCLPGALKGNERDITIFVGSVIPGGYKNGGGRIDENIDKKIEECAAAKTLPDATASYNELFALLTACFVTLPN
jgi:hypothetical protein